MNREKIKQIILTTYQNSYAENAEDLADEIASALQIMEDAEATALRMKMPKKLVRIGWADAIEINQWHTLEEALEWGRNDDWIVHQVGWVLEETNEYILLSCKYNEASNDRESNYGNLIKIPKGWVEYYEVIGNIHDNPELIN